MTYEFTFTVFTPTYNRRHTLHRVYQSLKIQTYRNFEWLVIDDGSMDNTHELIKQWQQENLFPIRYIYQENSGKHIAFNRGVKKAKGEFFLNLDSDDGCEANALERLKYHWNNIPEAEKELFSGVTCLCKTQEGNIIGSKYPFDIMDSNSLEIKYRYQVTGEKWGFHTTDVLKNFPFPTVTNASFIPEGLIWSAIGRQYKTRFVNEPLRIYYQDSIQGSLSTNKNFLKKTFVLNLWHKNILNKEIDFFELNPQYFCRSAIHYARFSLHSGFDLSTQFRELDTIKGRILWSVTFWLGFLVYCRDCLIYKH